MRLVVLLFVVAACGVPGEPIPDWTLAGNPDVAVTLPGNLFFELPRRDLDYTLRTTIPIRSEDRGHDLTLVVPCFHGDLALRANDRPIIDTGDTGTGEHRYLISPTGPEVDVVLFARQDTLTAIGFGVVPYVTHEPINARGTVASLNRTGALIELGLVGVFALLYIVMYLLARRPEDGAFVVLALCSISAPMWQLGLLPAVFGPFAASIPAFALATAQIGVLYFMHHAFGLVRPRRWMVWAFGTIAIGSFAGPLGFNVIAVFMVVLGIVTAIYVVDLMTQVLRLTRDPVRGTNMMILTVVMTITGLAVLPDVIALTIGRNFFAGVHTISLGIVGCILTQSILLSRTHVARQRELERIAVELRHQVAERSRALTVALAELARRPPEVLGADRVIADRYRVIKRLGAGGMGTVYEVARISDNQRLALKTLRGRTDPAAMARFTREAEIAAGLSHPNLVPVLDVGIADGMLFLVMPLVEGGSLEQQRPRFGDPVWARPLLAQIATGLAALHAGGIVHRDLKPGNVLLAEAARIADFGLAALDEPSGTQASIAVDDTAIANDATVPAATPSPPLTRAGDIFGTPRYMAPELAAGVGDAGPPVDIFALGVIAFEMLTRRQPFQNPIVMTRMNGEPIPAPSLDPLVDPLRALIARCLAIDPADRPTASELVAGFAS